MKTVIREEPGRFTLTDILAHTRFRILPAALGLVVAAWAQEAGNYGQVTSTGEARRVQLALKLGF